MTASSRHDSAPGATTATPRAASAVRVVDQIVEVIAAALLLGITGILFANAIARYALNSPIGGTEELATSLVVWLAMSGMYLSVRRRDLIRVELLLDQFSPRTRSRLFGLTYLATGAFFVYLALVSFAYLAEFGPDKTPFLRLPKGLFTSAIPIGSVLVAIAFAVNAWVALRGRERPKSIDEELAAVAPIDEPEPTPAIGDSASGMEPKE